MFDFIKLFRRNSRISSAVREVRRQHASPTNIMYPTHIMYPTATLYSQPMSVHSDKRMTNWPELYDHDFRAALGDRLRLEFPDHDVSFYPPNEWDEDWHCWVTPKEE